MPAFPFLFIERPGPPAAGQKVVSRPPLYAKAGVTVLLSQDAIDLVAYLLSLDHTYPVLPHAKGLP